MPQTSVKFYQNIDGSSPVVDWLDELKTDRDVVVRKFNSRLEMLRQMGRALDDPISKHLRAGIFELRYNVGHVNYRVLYFFHGRDVAVLAHALTKEKEVPESDIQTAMERRSNFIANPIGHTYKHRRRR